MFKRIFTIFTYLLFSLNLQAQAPKAIKYQKVVRDATGQPLANQQVAFGIDLIQNGASVYGENHQIVTNAIGAANLEIGLGTVVVNGVFSRIDWNLPTSVRVYLDPTGGTNVRELGTADLQPLLANGTSVVLDNDGGSIYISDNSANTLAQLANPEKGDLAYYDGTAWILLPKGNYSQLLNLNDIGAPIFVGENRTAQFKVTLPQGDMLSVHPTDNSVSVQWSNAGLNITSLTDLKTEGDAIMDFNGWANTQAIVTQFGINNNVNFAAKQCADLQADGFNDWYLPSAGELNEIYRQLGPTSAGGSGLITTGFYWSSSEIVDDGAWGQGFIVGNRGSSSKISESRCRCVRKWTK